MRKRGNEVTPEFLRRRRIFLRVSGSVQPGHPSYSEPRHFFYKKTAKEAPGSAADDANVMRKRNVEGYLND